jgi:short-subunit dehydrogenase
VPRTNYPFTQALITGASSGIGEQMAHMLGKAGVPMVLVARRGDRLQTIADQYKNVEVLTADLLTTEGVAAVEARLRDTTKPPVDFVVNNAGFGTSGPMHRIDPNRLANEVQLNVVALMRITSAAINLMLPRGRGYILNVSSVASFQAQPGLAVYSATKAFVTSFTEAVHQELANTGIRITALCPGLTKTEFQSVSNTSKYESRFPAVAWTSVKLVARTGINGVIKGKPIVVPGILYKTLVGITDVLPRSVGRWFIGLFTRR